MVMWHLMSSPAPHRVARNGKSFEERILNSEEGKTSKFNFMKATDPYYAYYEHKIRQFEEGKEVRATLPEYGE
jgi:splicing factor 3A subunit 1